MQAASPLAITGRSQAPALKLAPMMHCQIGANLRIGMALSLLEVAGALSGPLAQVAMEHGGGCDEEGDAEAAADRCQHGVA